MRTTFLSLWMFLAIASVTLGGEPILLIEADKPDGGWSFGDGPEFPGARGKLELSDERFHDQPVLSLSGDFNQGGNYVQAMRDLPDVPVDTLSFWVKAPAGSDQLPIRLIDGSGQVHQLRLRINDRGEWQQIVFPVEEYFRKMGTAGALDLTTQYEKWSGENDGRWHQPGTAFVILFSRGVAQQGTILLGDIQLHPSSDKKTDVDRTIRLDEMLQAGEMDWGFNLGQEFAGAKGDLELVTDQPEPGKNAYWLHADFTQGGAYVGIRKSFEHLDVKTMTAIRMKMRSSTTGSFSVRMVDGGGQTHQRKGISFPADGKWHDVALVPTEIAGQEHWGGPDDGKWRGAVKLIELMLNTDSHDGKKPDLYISDIRADVVVEARVCPPAWSEDFESKGLREGGWQTDGNVRIDRPGQGETKTALLLRRMLPASNIETTAKSRAFDVAPGPWQVGFAWKADLLSPDDSYHGAVSLEVFDHSGRALETIPLGIGYGKQDWQMVTQPVTLPTGAARARLGIQLNKTIGSFWVDQLSAAPLAMEPIEQRVEKIRLASDAVGNLFLPGDEVVVHVTVEAVKPLPTAEQTARYSLRDYWGAEQMPPGQVLLQKAPRQNDRFLYTADIRLPKEKIAMGEYYELHVFIPQEGAEPVGEYTGLAVLPPAEAKKYPPEQVPFTIRNWDSRISEYFYLADRLGLRQLGVWGGWSANAPYEPQLPGVEICEKLGAKWITGTPAASIERDGFKEYSEEALRQGMRNFLEKFADRGLMAIAIGNEPHGTGQKVLDNVRAYKAIYESAKALDPNILIIGTSVEPNEEYFKAGYQNYLDAYDFHIYEHYSNVRRTMAEYRELMKKYHAVKPIHSTELGLNSQGQTRRAVAIEMIKKFTVFFAEGGASVSWFTIQYPDPQGKARGQFGDSHCVFDCKYSLYNPRLDAIVYYNMINGIGAKEFVEEKQYPGGAQAYRFCDADGGSLEILWLDDARVDVALPMPEGRSVMLVQLDGRRTLLKSDDGTIGLTLSEEPVLLLYHNHNKDRRLPDALAASPVKLLAVPETISPGQTATFTLQGKGLTAEAIRVDGPPLWPIRVKQAGSDRVEVTFDVPAATPAREARFAVRRITSGSATGQWTVAVPVR